MCEINIPLIKHHKPAFITLKFDTANVIRYWQGSLWIYLRVLPFYKHFICVFLRLPTLRYRFFTRKFSSLFFRHVGRTIYCPAPPPTKTYPSQLSTRIMCLYWIAPVVLNPFDFSECLMIFGIICIEVVNSSLVVINFAVNLPNNK